MLQRSAFHLFRGVSKLPQAMLKVGQVCGSKRCFYDSSKEPSHKLSLRDIDAKFKCKSPIVMVTAYDVLTSRCAHLAEVDMILVGDSLGMVIFGDEGTNRVTIDEMVRHCRAVTNVKHCFTPFIVGDLPFSAYLTSEDAVRNAARLMCEGGCDAVKMEGGERVGPLIDSVIRAGIPVMGHLGLTPQTPSSIGGFKVQGTDAKSATAIYNDAQFLQSVGCFSLVLEAVPHKVASHITHNLSVPTIGIGAGPGCSGQVQVVHDISGMFHKFLPKFSKRYRLVGPQIETAVNQYRQDVLNCEFPAKQHCFTMRKTEFEQYLKLTQPERANSLVLVDQQHKTEEQNINKTISSGQHISHIDKTKMRIAVIGGGAMGSLVSHKLANQGGFQVTLITSWQEQVNAVNKKGLELKKVGVETVASKEPTLASENDVLGGGSLRAISASDVLSPTNNQSVSSADVVFVLTKSNSCRKAARVAAELITQNSIVVTLQNGVECGSIIREEFSSSKRSAVVIDGSTSHGAVMQEAGIVLHTGESLTVIGPATLTESGSRNRITTHAQASKMLADIMNQSGFQTQVASSATDLQRIKYTKLGVNCVINPLTAILGVHNSCLLGDPAVDFLARKLIGEFVNVMRAGGKKELFSDFEEEEMLKRVYEVASKTGPNRSSMLSDILRGAKTEIDYLNGFVVREANKLKIQVPCHEAVTSLVTSLQSARGRQNEVKLTSNQSTMTHVEQSSKEESEKQPKLNSSAPTVVNSVHAFRRLSRQHDFAGKKVGFVPTMGGLHEGHLNLVRRCKSVCDVTVVSIFVNPLQFAPHEDFDAYPRDLQADLLLLQAEGVDVVFAPSGSDLVPEAEPTVSLTVHGSDCKPEGASRPHFFHGVATIVLKLLNIVKPDLAFFGQKDAQQCATVKQLVADLNVDCEIVIGETVRETDGLAMSTRNKYLTPEERKAAPVIYDALIKAKRAFRDGERDVNVLKELVKQRLAEEPLLTVQYIAITDNFSMEEIDSVEASLKKEGICISMAGKMGQTRLIDNIVITQE